MAHNHSHNHHPLPFSGGSLSKVLVVGIVLNLVFVGIEFTAGWLLDSVALMSDAGHNLSDVVSLALALLAIGLARRKPSEKYTYGHKKSTILVSLANAFILLAAIGVIVAESIAKLRDPQPIQGEAIAWVAGAGIVINAFTAWLLLRHKNHDLNARGAYLHMAADTLVSVGVLVSGIVIAHTGYYVIDPIIGLVIAVVILISTWSLLTDSIRLSMDGVPHGIDVPHLTGEMLGADRRIKGIHHIHVWAISTTENAMTAHVVMDDATGAEMVKGKLKKLLQDHGIVHSTLEFELSGETSCDHPSDECSCR